MLMIFFTLTILFSGLKWRQHRKILTPTFHFKILEEFIDVFDTNGAIMADKLTKEVNGPGFDVYKYVTLCALDIICGKYVDKTF